MNINNNIYINKNKNDDENIFSDDFLLFPNSTNIKINNQKVKFPNQEIKKEIKFRKNLNFKVKENNLSENYLLKIHQKIKRTLLNSNINEEKSMNNKFV